MLVNDLFLQLGSKKKRKRVGRGIGSGIGKTSGRGHKGAGSRSGHSSRMAFEGGQTAVFRRVAKRGQSKPPGASEFKVIDISALGSAFENGDLVDSASLFDKSLISQKHCPYKILANGTISIALKLRVSSISRAAAVMICEQGGSVDCV